MARKPKQPSKKGDPQRSVELDPELDKRLAALSERGAIKTAFECGLHAFFGAPESHRDAARIYRVSCREVGVKIDSSRLLHLLANGPDNEQIRTSGD